MRPVISITMFLAMGLVIPGLGSAWAAAPVLPTIQPKATPASKFQATTWTGTLNAGDATLRLEIDIAGDVGKLRSLDQNNATFVLAEIQSDGDSLRFSIPALSARFGGKYRAERTVVDGIFAQGGAKLPLVLSTKVSTAIPIAADTGGRLKEAWVGQLNMGAMTVVMQFRIVVQPGGDTVGYFDSITEGRTGFPATWSVVADTLAFDVATIRLRYRGALNDSGDTAEGTWSQGGRNVPLTLKRQAHEYKNANVWANRPQRPVGPFPYDSEEVSFENQADGVTLAGTLTLPRVPGRHPAVVLITGSGPQDRDETMMEHKPFLVLADYLTRRGIAVLRYDDRGTAKSTGDFGRATTEDFARDAGAAVAFLAQHQRINPKEIGLAGHSEGGLVAPMVAGLRNDVAFVVLLAATGVDGATILVSQVETMLRSSGVVESEIQRAVKLNRAAFEVALRNVPDADFVKEIEPTIQEVTRDIPEANREAAVTAVRQDMRNSARRLKTAWNRFFMAYDPRPALRRMSGPVLAITGTNDTQVLHRLNVPAIRTALTEGGNKDFEIVELEGLNHMFQMSQTGSMNEYVTIQETVNPGALKVIGDWIVRHTTPIG